LNREADALSAFEAAAAVDPARNDLARRIEVLRFRGQQEALVRARDAARAGRLDEAVAAYNHAIEVSPESAILYRELATIERQQGDTDSALEHFRKAVALDAADVGSLVQLGDLLEARQDLDGAVKAYSAALALESDNAVEAKLQDVRAKAELASLPAEYRAIGTEAQITRADLAALVGLRLGSLLQPRRRDAPLITDIRGHWAAPWIVAVARAGVMEPFPNHAFLPRGVVRRTELAQVVSRLLTKLAEATPGHQASPWQSARGKFADLTEGHVAFPAVSSAVASGVMTVDADKNFYPARPVSGADAIEAIGRLQQMARPVAATEKSPR
jgi:tetratricopeptide (TPR) repeat protein